MATHKDLQKGILASVGFHILLLLLTLLVTVKMEPEVKEYAELSFARLTTPLPIQPARPKESVPPAPSGMRPEGPSTPVDLPKTRTLEEKELLPIPVPDKLGPEGGTEEAAKRGIGEKEPLHEVKVGDEERRTPAETPGEKEGPAFTIEGPAAGRAILSKVIPQYPPGLQKEVVVKARLTVLPNGLVSEVVPLQKGDPVLEELTVKALSQWKFNALPPDVPQLPQEGTITFVYRLK